MQKFNNCQKCKAPVSKNCHSGFCNRCRDRSGKNNPFFGKTHDKETIEGAKIKLAAISKALWQDKIYRDKVIKSISKPRRAGFKSEQSVRMSNWYRDNPEQSSLRSESMKRSWAEGKIEPNINSINESKMERDLLSEVRKLFPDRNVRKSTLKIGGRWFYPDIRIDDKTIIEFNGDFWHGNPEKYKRDDIIIHGMTAGQIWQRDADRLKILRDNGFKVLVVWQNDYRDNKQEVLDKILLLDLS